MKKKTINQQLRTNNQGFTIIELLIATVAFTIMLLICTVALVQIGRLYYKGITTNNTQEIARTVIDDISRSIQFGGESPYNNPTATNWGAPTNIPVHSFCIGSTRYSYALDAQVSDDASINGMYQTTSHHIRHALWRDQTSTPLVCAPLDLTSSNPDTTAGANHVAGTTGVELLAVNMRLSYFSLSNAIAPKLWNISAYVVYGDEDLLNKSNYPPHIACQSTLSGFGGQFCAVSELTTVVRERLL